MSENEMPVGAAMMDMPPRTMREQVGDLMNEPLERVRVRVLSWFRGHRRMPIHVHEYVRLMRLSDPPREVFECTNAPCGSRRTVLRATGEVIPSTRFLIDAGQLSLPQLAKLGFDIE